ncbi:AAA family ATPase, partial [Candidatus Nomurabacteria bacterium]|nr:AAA family ATPase [Candidatus Nomurabacteria bacterium]
MISNPTYIQFNRDDPIQQPEWIIPGLRAGQVCLITAPGGTGKSFLLLEIAMSVASGHTLLPGLEVTIGGKVCLLNFEDDAFDIKQRGNSILRHFKDLEPDENLFVASMSGYTLGLLNSSGEASENDVKWLKEQCEGVRLLVLDPLSHLHTADENSASQMSKLIQVLKGIGQETGTGIIVAHHTGKNAVLNKQGGLQQSARGSSALVDASKAYVKHL